MGDFGGCRLRRQKILLFWGLYTGGKRAEGARNFWVLCSLQEGKSSKICQNSGQITNYNYPPLVSPDFGPKGGLIDLNTPDRGDWVKKSRP